MAQQTQADGSDEQTIESVEIVNAELVDVLATVVTYERTNGARQHNPLLAVVGDGPHKMLVEVEDDVVDGNIELPDIFDEASVCDTIHGTSLVGKGELMDTISVCGQDAELQVL